MKEYVFLEGVPLLVIFPNPISETCIALSLFLVHPYLFKSIFACPISLTIGMSISMIQDIFMYSVYTIVS